MLLDRLMPHCDFVERHEIVTTASPERVYAALRTADFAGHPVVKALLVLRGMGRKAPALGVDSFRREGFYVIGDDPPRELVIGLEGPFWKPACKLRPVSAATFATPVTGNVARGAWNFLVERQGDGSTRLSTETRVLCSDESRLKFRLYWSVIRFFSGLTRRFMLRSIRAEAER